MMVFLAMSLIFAMVYPLASSAARSAIIYNQTIALAQHKVDQLRAFTWFGQNMSSPATCTTLSNQLVSTGVANSCSGSGPITCSFANQDSIVANGTNAASGLLPYGSTATFTITPDSGVPAGQVFTIAVVLSWSGGGIPAGSVTLPAKITQMSP